MEEKRITKWDMAIINNIKTLSELIEKADKLVILVDSDELKYAVKDIKLSCETLENSILDSISEHQDEIHKINSRKKAFTDAEIKRAIEEDRKYVEYCRDYGKF